MKTTMKNILTGLLAGFAVGIVIEGVAAFAGSVHGGAEGALRWAQAAGLVVAVISVWLLMREFSASGGRRPFIRPGRTRLEMEYEVQDENRRYEQNLRESGGEAHRMPRWGNLSLIALDIGVLLSALVPMCITLPL